MRCARLPRTRQAQLGPGALAGFGKTGHHMADHEGADDFSAHRVDALQVVDVVRQGTAALGRRDDAAV